MQTLPANPALYEINTRVWLRQFDSTDKRATLHDIPDAFWSDLHDKGMHIVWLMGVWQINAGALYENDLSAELRTGYDEALPDWSDEDVIGSPYAIDEYVVADDLGGREGLAHVRKQLARYKLRLMLDFVPNHFSRATRLLTSHPDVFVSTKHDSEHPDSFNPELFFTHETGSLFAHGRDPFFAPWWDTVQVNYASAIARDYMTAVLQEIASQCDGVRCDMAMLDMNDIFQRTWSSQVVMEMPQSEFWVDAIAVVKDTHPKFLFMAEAYWDKEWDLQQQGFDYTYDKRLTDRLESGDVAGVAGHLHANADYQSRSVRFIENHDEPRAVKAFGREASLAAAVIVSTLPGMHFFHDGQWQGKAVRLPVQLGREPVEATDEGVTAFYDDLLPIINLPVFQHGQWTLLSPASAWPSNELHGNILAWQWQDATTQAVVIVNMSGDKAQCRLVLPSDIRTQELLINDVLNGTQYRRAVEEITGDGLYIELGAWRSHVFLIGG